jgi:transposase
VAALEAQVQKLLARVAELQSRLNQNSQNSSKPPSSDPPWNKQTPAKPKSSRPRGGQPGHEGHCRQLLPAERVHKRVQYFPQQCAMCGKALPQKPQTGVPEPTLHQVIELPEQPLQVTQYEGWACHCEKCGYVTRAEIPPEILAHSLGPRLTTLLALLAGLYHMSDRQIQDFVATALGAPLGLGSIPRHEQEVAGILKPDYQKAQAVVRAAPAKNMDETGWKWGRVLCWLWVVATVGVAYFQITKSRGRKGFQEVLRAVKGVLTTDRGGAFSKLDPERHQICWAHLGRDFQRFYEMAGCCREVGRAGRRAHRKLFKLWQQYKNGALSRAELATQMEPVRQRLQRALQRGRDSPDKKARRFCKRLLKVYPALWTFVKVEGVEPTNNFAERSLRPAVLWRKGSFGSNSKKGCEFVAIILTIVQTLRLQNKPVLESIAQAVAAARAGQAVPSLI